MTSPKKVLGILVLMAQLATVGPAFASQESPLGEPTAGPTTPAPTITPAPLPSSTPAPLPATTPTTPAPARPSPLPPASQTVAWTALGDLEPLWNHRSSTPNSQVLASDPADPRRLAYCVGGGIRLSLDGGATWAVIPTDGVASAAERGGFSLLPTGGLAPACRQVFLDPVHRASFYAVFDGAVIAAPPVYRLGFVTVDGGQTWESVTPPPDYGPFQFGGFVQDGPVVRALFANRPEDPSAPPSFSVSQTVDGGQSWAAAVLPCPQIGPCLRWGPAPPVIAGMGAPRPQWVETSPDSGRTWTPAGPEPVDLKSMGPHELVALSPNEALLVRSGEPVPLLVTRDAGETWQPVALPRPAGSSAESPLVGLQLLPGGRLLARAPVGSAWLLLESGATSWCTAAEAPPSWTVGPPRALGRRLWWLEEGPLTDPDPVPASIPLENLTCAPTALEDGAI